MLAFIGPSDLTVNHIDLNKTNNRIFNLEYISKSENSLHFHKNGTRNMPRGENHHNSVVTDRERMEIRLLKEVLEYKTIASMYKISLHTVIKIVAS